MRSALILMLFITAGCAKVVKDEGFRAAITEAADPTLKGTFTAGGDGSCGVVGPSVREIRLVGEGFSLGVVEVASGSRVVTLDVRGQGYTSDRPGADSTMVLDMPRGRIIGSLQATLVNEAAGTSIDGRPAPVRELAVDVTFNLQPCL